MVTTTPKRTGFGTMTPEQKRAIASKGGKAAHAHGRAHQFTSEQARIAGAKGGAAIAKDRAHMAEIGRRGGHTVASDRAHMAEIGSKGGAAAKRKANGA